MRARYYCIDWREPNSVTQHGNLVYVLNTAGSSSVVGFYFDDGKFVRISNSIRFISANAVGSGVVAFSPHRRFLLVTEKVTNAIDIFQVSNEGTLSPITVNTDVGPGTFSGTFAPSGVALVAEKGPAGPTLGTANCWSVVTVNGRYVYPSNSGSSSIGGLAHV
jgi:6-phosphogluconolactonase